jgi:hypothetical protein
MGSVFFPFAARDRRRKLHMERAVFFFLLLPGTGGGSYTWNGQCFFFLLLPGTGGGSYTLHCPPSSAIESVTRLCRINNPVTERHHTVAFIYKISTFNVIHWYNILVYGINKITSNKISEVIHTTPMQYQWPIVA